MTIDALTVAPDGSPIAFYRRLPAEGEPELVHGLLPAGATILDIGCATGRIAGPLVALGHPVTGVDDGPGMIAALPAGVEGVVGDGRSIRLGRRFDAVLLVSHLVNLPGDGPAFAATAAAHVQPEGVVIGQTYPPGTDPTAGVGQRRQIGDAHVELVSAVRVGDRIESTVRYGVDGEEWTQSFTSVLLDEAALRSLLADVGLTFDRWLDLPGWFLARPT
jgi:SAM-dependent methyltransferase